MTKNEAEKRIKFLRSEIHHHDALYYSHDNPEIPDYEYDKMFNELKSLEASHPEFEDVNSPTQRVGGVATGGFKKVKHKVPFLSLDKVHSYEEFKNWYEDVKKRLGN